MADRRSPIKADYGKRLSELEPNLLRESELEEAWELAVEGRRDCVVALARHIRGLQSKYEPWRFKVSDDPRVNTARAQGMRRD